MASTSIFLMLLTRLGPKATVAQEAHDVRLDGIEEASDVLLADGGSWVKDRRSEGAGFGVDAVQEQGMDVNIEIESRSKALHDVHRSSAAIASAFALQQGLIESEDCTQEGANWWLRAGLAILQG